MNTEYFFIIALIVWFIFVVLFYVLIFRPFVKNIKKEMETKITLNRQKIGELKTLDVIREAERRQYLSLLKQKKEDLDRELERLEND